MKGNAAAWAKEEVILFVERFNTQRFDSHHKTPAKLSFFDGEPAMSHDLRVRFRYYDSESDGQKPQGQHEPGNPDIAGVFEGYILAHIKAEQIVGQILHPDPMKKALYVEDGKGGFYLNREV